MNKARHEYIKKNYPTMDAQAAYRLTKNMYPKFNHAIWVNGALILKK